MRNKVQQQSRHELFTHKTDQASMEEVEQGCCEIVLANSQLAPKDASTYPWVYPCTSKYMIAVSAATCLVLRSQLPPRRPRAHSRDKPGCRRNTWRGPSQLSLPIGSHFAPSFAQSRIADGSSSRLMFAQMPTLYKIVRPSRPACKYASVL